MCKCVLTNILSDFFHSCHCINTITFVLMQLWLCIYTTLALCQCISYLLNVAGVGNVSLVWLTTSLQTCRHFRVPEGSYKDRMAGVPISTRCVLRFFSLLYALIDQLIPCLWLNNITNDSE